MPNHLATVTATRRGLTADQIREARFLFSSYALDGIVHGAAHGGDSDLHYVAHDLAMFCDIWPASGVPSNITGLRVSPLDVVHEPAPPLDRNKTMVDLTDKLFAFPAGYDEELRSGTWAAIRYARKQHKSVTLIFPDGSVVEEDRVA